MCVSWLLCTLKAFGVRLVIQGYLTYKETHPPRTLPYAYAQGPAGVLWGVGVWARYPCKPKNKEKHVLSPIITLDPHPEEIYSQFWF